MCCWFADCTLSVYLNCTKEIPSARTKLLTYCTQQQVDYSSLALITCTHILLSLYSTTLHEHFPSQTFHQLWWISPLILLLMISVLIMSRSRQVLNDNDSALKKYFRRFFKWTKKPSSHIIINIKSCMMI